MMIKRGVPTIPKELSSKTILLNKNPNLKEEIKTYFLKTYDVYEKLFELLGDERAYYIRAQPLRHPLIFYYGHTASLYVNKFIDHGLITLRINERLEKVFAVGVDQMDWDDLNQSHYEWPTLSEAREFRKKVKDMVLSIIQRSQERHIDNWLSGLWVIMLGIQHERIHLETSAVIMRMVPLEYIKKVEDFVECQYKQNALEKVPINQFVQVSPWKSTWNRNLQNLTTYGWDSQFGIKQFDVAGFQASKMLVSNAQYLQFVKEGGYNNLDWWTQEGQRWIISKKRTMPVFWVKVEEEYKLRTITQIIDMPWDWPAQVNNLEARAFCKWKSAKLNTYIRLPTEDQYYSIRRSLKEDQTEWEYQSVGNINMQFWMSPNPVNMFKNGDFYDVVGNVWQHTITPVYPFKQFEIHPVYEDFSTPTFDERHDMIKGGSFISTGNEALYHARYAFRRHFYQFAGFRYISTPIELELDLHTDEVVSDYNVEMNLKHHYLNDQSYILQLSEQIRNATRHSAKNCKILTVGCSVGRAPIEFSKYFRESIGIDYTTRYFQMSTRLKQKKFLKHKDIDINLDSLNLNPESTELYQMNPQNPDEKKINNCDWIVIDGFSLRKNCIGNVLKKITALAKSSCNIAVLNVSDFNDLSQEQEKKILASSVNGQVVIGQEKILKSSFNDQSYLPNCQERLQFRLNFYSIIEP